MTLPRILVLDDLFFWSTEDRAIWCRKLGLADVTDGTEAALGDYVAEAVFQSAQVRIGNSLVNSKDDAVNAVANALDSEARRNTLSGVTGAALLASA